MGSWTIIAIVVGIVLAGGFWLRKRATTQSAARATAAAHRMPDWVATMHDQLTSAASGENPTSGYLGDPLPTLVAESTPEDSTEIRGRLAILASEEQTAHVVRRHFVGMAGVTVEIFSDPSALCADRTQDGTGTVLAVDLLLTEPDRVAEIPASLVCPIVPIRSPVRRARLLAEVRAGLEAARLATPAAD